MAQNKKDINSGNFNEWLRSTGFLLPANELELKRFEKLHSTFDYELDGSVIDPTSIINGLKSRPLPKQIDDHQVSEFNNFKMVARNGSDLPPHILAKMKQNQDKNKNDNGSKEEKTK
jgi:hypothetical protein